MSDTVLVLYFLATSGSSHPYITFVTSAKPKGCSVFLPSLASARDCLYRALQNKDERARDSQQKGGVFRYDLRHLVVDGLIADRTSACVYMTIHTEECSRTSLWIFHVSRSASGRRWVPDLTESVTKQLVTKSNTVCTYQRRCRLNNRFAHFEFVLLWYQYIFSSRRSQV